MIFSLLAKRYLEASLAEAVNLKFCLSLQPKFNNGLRWLYILSSSGNIREQTHFCPIWFEFHQVPSHSIICISKWHCCTFWNQKIPEHTICQEAVMDLLTQQKTHNSTNPVAAAWPSRKQQSCSPSPVLTTVLAINSRDAIAHMSEFTIVSCKYSAFLLGVTWIAKVVETIQIWHSAELGEHETWIKFEDYDEILIQFCF